MSKLVIQKLNAKKESMGPDHRIEVPYNPTEIAFSKAASFADVAIPGLDGPVIQFVKGEAETLALELFLDATEGGRGAEATSVLETADRLHRLVKLDGNLHSPPLVRITWGQEFPGLALGDSAQPQTAFDAVVISCARRFTLFSTEGKPLRAVISLQLKEFLTLQEQVELANLRSPDHTRSHTVRQGETLPLIAYDAYDDAAKWRVIAIENGLADARRLTPGQQLRLPPIR